MSSQSMRVDKIGERISLPVSDEDKIFPRIKRHIVDKIYSYLGRPLKLERYLRRRQIERSRLVELTIAKSHSVSWDIWPSISNHYREGVLQYWIDRGEGHRADEIEIPEILTLVTCSTEKWYGKIRDIKSVSNSKSNLETFETLDALAIGNKDPYLNTLTSHQLHQNLTKWRSSDGFFHVPDGDSLGLRSWSQNDPYLANSDGSHRFAAARLLAGLLGEDINLAGPLNTYKLDIASAQSLIQKYEIFLLSDSDMYCGITDAAKSFGINYGIYGAPMSMNRRDSWPESGLKAQTLFIKPDGSRYEVFIRYLRAAGIVSINDLLTESLRIQALRSASNRSTE